MSHEPPRLEGPTPLTNFLIAMAHSPELVPRLYARTEDDSFKKDWGLTDDQLEVLREGNLRAIQEAVNAELPAGTDATAAFWIGVGRWPIPWPWIGSMSGDEPSESP